MSYAHPYQEQHPATRARTNCLDSWFASRVQTGNLTHVTMSRFQTAKNDIEPTQAAMKTLDD
eukprot:6186597-Pleurochrysis_carterae.AAC.2